MPLSNNGGPAAGEEVAQEGAQATAAPAGPAGGGQAVKLSSTVAASIPPRHCPPLSLVHYEPLDCVVYVARERKDSWDEEHPPQEGGAQAEGTSGNLLAPLSPSPPPPQRPHPNLTLRPNHWRSVGDTVLCAVSSDGQLLTRVVIPPSSSADLLKCTWLEHSSKLMVADGSSGRITIRGSYQGLLLLKTLLGEVDGLALVELADWQAQLLASSLRASLQQAKHGAFVAAAFLAALNTALGDTSSVSTKVRRGLGMVASLFSPSRGVLGFLRVTLTHFCVEPQPKSQPAVANLLLCSGKDRAAL